MKKEELITYYENLLNANSKILAEEINSQYVFDYLVTSSLIYSSFINHLKNLS